MALKTFNIDAEAYEEFSKTCREKGISMSKKVENFIKNELVKMKVDIEKLEAVEKKIEEEFKEEAEHPLRKYC